MLTAEKQVFVTVSKDGPYIMSGNARLAEQAIVANANGESLRWQEGKAYGAREKCALCRCGHSGIYGDTINIAARMEEAARSHGVRCVISRAVSDALAVHDRFEALGEERVKGISAPIAISAYQVRESTA